MLTLEQANEEGTVCIEVTDPAIDGLLAKEWLLTNSRGSYAASTIAGCNTSSYHGLLVGSLNPPAHRLMALANCLEMVICDRRVSQLSTFEFTDKFAPAGYTYLREFRRDAGAHFVYQTDAAVVEKAVYLSRGDDTVALEYTFSQLAKPIEFVVRPFVGLRDFHLLQRSYAPLTFKPVADGLSVRHDVPGSCELLLSCPAMRFEKDAQWWFNFRYRINVRRGQDGTEDLWTPGFFKARVERPGRLVFRAHLGQRCRPEDEPLPDVDEIKSELQQHRQSLLDRARAQSPTGKLLCLAADQFIAQHRAGGVERCTILAGFPWFADWGRDAFIALPGLLLATGRHEQARSVLRNFAGVVDRGMIPNRFDDRSPTAYFNSVDASLWFVHAAFVYLEATEDLDGFTQELLPAVQWIIDAYEQGTRFGIRADTDGLITAGDEQTQLTWMDAKYGGVAFTPRWGKAVEVNALWHNALARMQRFYEGLDASHAARYRDMREKVGASFVSLFWNDGCGYLNDTVRPDGSADASLRPNQIFAVSLPHGPPLAREQQQAVVDVIERELLTPYGLRTLNCRHEAYRGRYEGALPERDGAYHQGTAWPFLLGPFVEAYLNVHDFSTESRARAAQLVEPLLSHLVEDGCLGSVAEIFDGDAPQRPCGCPAQAWSVGELIRVCRLIHDGQF